LGTVPGSKEKAVPVVTARTVKEVVADMGDKSKREAATWEMAVMLPELVTPEQNGGYVMPIKNETVRDESELVERQVNKRLYFGAQGVFLISGKRVADLGDNPEHPEENTGEEKIVPLAAEEIVDCSFIDRGEIEDSGYVAEQLVGDGADYLRVGILEEFVTEQLEERGGRVVEVTGEQQQRIEQIVALRQQEENRRKMWPMIINGKRVYTLLSVRGGEINGMVVMDENGAVKIDDIYGSERVEAGGINQDNIRGVEDRLKQVMENRDKLKGVRDCTAEAISVEEVGEILEYNRFLAEQK